jgi:hypothetical protein
MYLKRTISRTGAPGTNYQYISARYCGSFQIIRCGPCAFITHAIAGKGLPRKILGRPLDNFPEIFRRIGHVILRRRRQPHFRDYSTPSHKLNVERLALWSEVPFDESTGALIE